MFTQNDDAPCTDFATWARHLLSGVSARIAAATVVVEVHGSGRNVRGGVGLSCVESPDGGCP